jgi:hypothetical protein
MAVMAVAPGFGSVRRIRTRFFTGARVYNAVLGEFIARSRHQPAYGDAHMSNETAARKVESRTSIAGKTSITV